MSCAYARASAFASRSHASVYGLIFRGLRIMLPPPSAPADADTTCGTSWSVSPFRSAFPTRRSAPARADIPVPRRYPTRPRAESSSHRLRVCPTPPEWPSSLAPLRVQPRLPARVLTHSTDGVAPAVPAWRDETARQPSPAPQAEAESRAMSPHSIPLPVPSRRRPSAIRLSSRMNAPLIPHRVRFAVDRPQQVQLPVGERAKLRMETGHQRFRSHAPLRFVRFHRQPPARQHSLLLDTQIRQTRSLPAIARTHR